MSFETNHGGRFSAKTGWMALLALGISLSPRMASAQTYGAWTSQSKIVLNTSATGANVAGEVKAFPIAIALTATNFDFTKAQSKGEDLRFSDAAGAALPYEIEYWDATAKKAAVWVKADVKGNDAAQSITMYWGNPAAKSESDSKAVFALADGWMGVWHMSEAGNTTAGGYKDATANEAHGTGTNFTAANTADCIAGKCPEFDNPSKRSINIGGEKAKLFNLTQKLTFSVWVKAKNYTEAYQTPFAKGDKSWRVQMYGIYSWGDNNGKYVSETCVQAGGGDGACLEHHNDEIKPNEWRQLTVVADNPKISYYIDMNMVTTSAGTAWSSADYDVGIGWQSQYKGRWWTGNLDEARVLNVAKDQNWVKLNFESQKPTSKFVEIKPATTRLRSGTVALAPSKAPVTGRFDVHGRRLGKHRQPGIYLEQRIADNGSVVTTKRALID